MTSEAMRVAIAEAMGFVWRTFRLPDIDESSLRYHCDGRVEGKDLIFSLCKPDENWTADIPDYPNDLNSCHDALATLTPDEQEWFAIHLENIVLGGTYFHGRHSELMIFKLANATAAHVSEAIVRCKNLWKD